MQFTIEGFKCLVKKVYDLFKRVTIIEDILENTSPVIPSLDRALIAKSAFVNREIGNDTTGVVGDANLPFLTVNNAIIASQHVILEPGEYTEFLNFTRSTNIYEMSGVIHNGGHYRSSTTTGDIINILGYGVYQGDHGGVKVVGDATVRWEFDKAINVSEVVGAFVDANIKVKANSITCHGHNNFGGACTLRDRSQVDIRVKEYFYCQHRLVFARTGNAVFSGSLILKCPDMRVVENYQASYGNVAKGIIDCQQGSGASFDIEGNMTLEHSTPASFQGAFAFYQGGANKTTIKFRGRINGGASYAVSVTSEGASDIELDFEGEFSSTNLATLYLSTVVGANIYAVFKNSSIVTELPLYFNGPVKAYLMGCSIYSRGTANIATLSSGPTAGVNLNISNTIIQGEGTVTELMTNPSPLTINLFNVGSNKPLTTNTSDPQGGLVFIPTLQTINK